MSLNKIVIMILIMGYASAENITYGVYDINTRNPIEAVEIKTYNNLSNLLNTSVTNANGLLDLQLNESSTYYIIQYVKIGYFPYEKNNTYDPIDTDLEFLTPITQDGIIRIRFNDLTLTKHKFCLFFKENGRLDGCYLQNDTITILVNREYIIRPELETLDVFSSTENIKNYSYIYSGLIIGMGLLFSIVFIFVAIIFKMIRK